MARGKAAEAEAALVLDESGQNAVPADELEKEAPAKEVSAEALIRRSQADANAVFDALAAYGSVSVAEEEEEAEAEPEAEEEE